MFPLKVFRFFSPVTEVTHTATNGHRSPTPNSIKEEVTGEEAGWPEVDRRQSQDRRHDDRREKQDAILLNTRKLQGRRKDTGRRLSDKTQTSRSRLHVSVKG